MVAPTGHSNKIPMMSQNCEVPLVFGARSLLCLVLKQSYHYVAFFVGFIS